MILDNYYDRSILNGFEGSIHDGLLVDGRFQTVDHDLDHDPSPISLYLT